MEDLALEIVAGTVDHLRRAVGLGSDPDAETLRRSPYLTVFPASLEDPAAPDQPATSRFRDPAWDAPPAALPDWWPDADAPLVYVTFGSVAGGLAMAAGVYRLAIEVMAELPVRALLTVGRDVDLGAFAETPDNVHVEAWVAQANVLGHAAAVVCHGGSGSTLGALAAGVPAVVVPLFADQPYNARRVEAVGAGIAVSRDAEALRAAVQRVLEDGSYRAAAEGLAAEMRTQPPVDDALDLLAGLSRSASRR
jgi:MGT family glycosyltransferase